VNQVKTRRFLYILAIIVTMAAACFASIAILAGGMAALYGLDWYKNRRRQNRRLTKKLAEEDYITKEQQPIAEQLA
jgi:hypothetical protein